MLRGNQTGTTNLRFTLLSLGLLVAACGKPDRLEDLASSAIGGPPPTMTIRINNYRPQPGKAFQHLFVSNFSVKAKNSRLYRSTSRDGMPDELKTVLNPTYGFLISGPETVVVGFADLVLFNLGIQSPQQNLVFCSSMQMDSSTNDAFIYNDSRLIGNPQVFLGLRDCEKNYLGLNPNKWSNSNDGIPDYLKMRCGLNPANTFDAFISTAGDGVANIDKCKMNIPVDESAFTDANQYFAYKYDIDMVGDGSGQFEISNIPIIDDGEENFIAIYVSESDLSDQSLSLYSAYAILRAPFTNRTLELDYWALQGVPSSFQNQRIAIP